MLRISCGDTAVNSEQFQQFFATTFAKKLLGTQLCRRCSLFFQPVPHLCCGALQASWSKMSLGNISTVEGAPDIGANDDGRHSVSTALVLVVAMIRDDIPALLSSWWKASQEF